MSSKPDCVRTEQRLLLALLAICCSAVLAACSHVKVIDPNTTIVQVKAGTTNVPAVDGYFVPEATMLRLMDRLSEIEVWGTSPVGPTTSTNTAE